MGVLRSGDLAKVERLTLILHIINLLSFKSRGELSVLKRGYLDPGGGKGYWKSLGMKARRINRRGLSYAERKSSFGSPCDFCRRRDFLVLHHWYEGSEYHSAFVCHSCNILLREPNLTVWFGGIPPRRVQELYALWRLEVGRSGTKKGLCLYLRSEGVDIGTGGKWSAMLKGLGEGGSHNGD